VRHEWVREYVAVGMGSGSVTSALPAHTARDDCGGCHGSKARRGTDRGEMGLLYRQRRRLCRTCTQKEMCYIAHQKPCSQRRLLSDPKMFCPVEPPKW